MRGRVGMFGRAPVIDRQRGHPRRAAGFRHHTAMTDDRARAVAAAMEEQQHARSIAARGKRPLAAYAAAIDAFAFHIVRDRPMRPDFIEPFTALRPSDWPRL